MSCILIYRLTLKSLLLELLYEYTFLSNSTFSFRHNGAVECYHSKHSGGRLTMRGRGGRDLDISLLHLVPLITHPRTILGINIEVLDGATIPKWTDAQCVKGS